MAELATGTPSAPPDTPDHAIPPSEHGLNGGPPDEQPPTQHTQTQNPEPAYVPPPPRPDTGSVTLGTHGGRNYNFRQTESQVIKRNIPNKVYIGGLPEDTRQEDLESCFGKIGVIDNIELKIGFGFVEFATKAAAEEAVNKYHEGFFLGNKIRVELSRGSKKTTGDPANCFKCGEPGHWARECEKPDPIGTPGYVAPRGSLVDRMRPPPPMGASPRDMPRSPYRDDYGPPPGRYSHDPRYPPRPPPPRDYYPPPPGSSYGRGPPPPMPPARDRYDIPPAGGYRRGSPPPVPPYYDRYGPPPFPPPGAERYPPRGRDDYRDYPPPPVEYRGRPMSPPRYPDYDPRGPPRPAYRERSRSPPRGPPYAPPYNGGGPNMAEPPYRSGARDYAPRGSSREPPPFRR